MFEVRPEPYWAVKKITWRLRKPCGPSPDMATASRNLNGIQEMPRLTGLPLHAKMDPQQVEIGPS